MRHLGIEERFILEMIASEWGVLGERIIVDLDKFELTERIDTGVGFLSTISSPIDIFHDAPEWSISKTFEMRGIGQILAFDLFIQSDNHADIEGVALTGVWPNPFRPGELKED